MRIGFTSLIQSLLLIKIGDVVWKVLYYVVADLNQYKGWANFQYYYYSVSGTCGNQADGAVYHGEGPVDLFPEPPESPENPPCDQLPFIEQ